MPFLLHLTYKNVLKAEMKRFVLVQIRGLTGIATVTDIITQSDLAILLSQEGTQ